MFKGLISPDVTCDQIGGIWHNSRCYTKTEYQCTNIDNLPDMQTGQYSTTTKQCRCPVGTSWNNGCVKSCQKITLNSTYYGGVGGTSVIYKKINSKTIYSDNECTKVITTITPPTKENAYWNGTLFGIDGGHCIYADENGQAYFATENLIGTSCNTNTTWYNQFFCNIGYLEDENKNCIYNPEPRCSQSLGLYNNNQCECPNLSVYDEKLMKCLPVQYAYQSTYKYLCQKGYEEYKGECITETAYDCKSTTGNWIDNSCTCPAGTKLQGTECVLLDSATQEQACNYFNGTWTGKLCMGSTGTLWDSQWSTNTKSFECPYKYDIYKNQSSTDTDYLHELQKLTFDTNGQPYDYAQDLQWDRLLQKCTSYKERNCIASGNTYDSFNYICYSHKNDKSVCDSVGGKYSYPNQAGSVCSCVFDSGEFYWNSIGKCTYTLNGVTTISSSKYHNFAESCIGNKIKQTDIFNGTLKKLNCK